MSLWTTTYPKTVVASKQGHAACKIRACSTKPLFISVQFNGDHETAYKDEVKSDHPQFYGYYRINNCGVCLTV